MTDICSIWAFEEIRKSGLVGKRQAMYLFIFAREMRPLGAKEATKLVSEEFGEKFSMMGIGSRLSELTNMGFLEKVEKKECPYSYFEVNHWRYTGRKRPLEKIKVSTTCSHCDGVGVVEKEICVKETGQTEFGF